MEQMAPFLADEARAEPASHLLGGNSDGDRPLELVRSREYDGRCVRRKLEQVLEGRFDRGEGPAVVAFDFQ